MEAYSLLRLPRDEAEEFRAMAHRELDRWIDEHIAGLFERDKPPTLKEMSEIFQNSRSQLLGACLEGLAERIHATALEQVWADCPRCGRRVRRKRVQAKGFSTLQGRGTLDRPYFYCAQCEHGFCPADEALELAPQVHQFDIQERVVELAAEVPFERCGELFERLTAVPVGNHFSHETLLAVGEVATLELVTPDRETIERKIADLRGQSPHLPILVAAADGAHMPLRQKGGRKDKRGKGDYEEAKGFRLFLVGEDHRIVQIASWHQVQERDELEEALAFVAERIPVEQVRIALLADGAPYLWDILKACFPTGTAILDYYHCAEHIHAVARCLYGESLLARQWAEAMKARIWLGSVKGAIRHLRHVPARSAKGVEEIRKLIGYLSHHADKIAYAANRAEGYPIGSGGMESAHKAVCHTRIKRTGAWWLRENCNEMLRIRCALYNGTFDRVFQRYIDTQRTTALGP